MGSVRINQRRSSPREGSEHNADSVVCKRIKTSNAVSNEATRSSDWGGLIRDVLRRILVKLSPNDLFVNAGLVCRWWRQVVGEALYWPDHRTLDLAKLTVLVAVNDKVRMYDSGSILSRTLNLAMYAFPANQMPTIETMIVPNKTLGNDTHLSRLCLWIFIRSPKLKRLELYNASIFHANTLRLSFQRWSELEEVTLGHPTIHVKRTIRSMGEHCKNLRALRIHGTTFSRSYFMLDKCVSAAMAKYLQHLKVLDLTSIPIYRSGLLTVLRECRSLVEINISECHMSFSGSLCCKPQGQGWRCSHKTARLRRHEDGDSAKWSIDSMDGLYGLGEVVEHLGL